MKDTNNPEYNQTFTIPIQRSSRACLRVFKRHGVKFEVYSKGYVFLVVFLCVIHKDIFIILLFSRQPLINSVFLLNRFYNLAKIRNHVMLTQLIM